MNKVVLLFIAIIPFSISAEPLISYVNLESDNKYLRITGEGFGEKPDAEPLLWIMGRDVREKGIVNTSYKSVSGGDLVPTGVGEVWSRGDSAVFHEEGRHTGIDISYAGIKDGWIGWPNVHGGDDTPHGDKAFIGYRVKPWSNVEYARETAYTSLIGDFELGSNEFDAGENITLTYSSGQVFDGHIIYLDEAGGRIHYSVSGISGSLLGGAEIEGVDTGAKVTLDPGTFSRNAYGTKYLRVYENVSKGGGFRGIRSTNRQMTSMTDVSGATAQGTSVVSDTNGYGVEKVSNVLDWRLLETYVDLEAGRGYHHVDNEGHYFFDGLNLDHKATGASPTIANIGWEAAGGTETIHAALSFGEIYFDNTPQRVVVSSKPEFSMVRWDMEYQYPVAWTEKSIVVEINYGAFNTDDTLYVYVFDANGVVNDKGFKICKVCKARPESPQIIDIKSGS